MTENRDSKIERAYKSIWHALIAAMGFYELRNHKTKLSKVLAVGLIAGEQADAELYQPRGQMAQ